MRCGAVSSNRLHIGRHIINNAPSLLCCTCCCCCCCYRLVCVLWPPFYLCHHHPLHSSSTRTGLSYCTVQYSTVQHSTAAPPHTVSLKWKKYKWRTVGYKLAANGLWAFKNARDSIFKDEQQLTTLHRAAADCLTLNGLFPSLRTIALAQHLKLIWLDNAHSTVVKWLSPSVRLPHYYVTLQHIIIII